MDNEDFKKLFCDLIEFPENDFHTIVWISGNPMNIKTEYFKEKIHNPNNSLVRFY